MVAPLATFDRKVYCNFSKPTETATIVHAAVRRKPFVTDLPAASTSCRGPRTLEHARSAPTWRGASTVEIRHSRYIGEGLKATHAAHRCAEPDLLIFTECETLQLLVICEVDRRSAAVSKIAL